MSSLFFGTGVSINQFYNFKTLNIFSDASIIRAPYGFDGCYGVVAVVRDEIIDTTMRLVSNTTVNNCEIKGIRAAIDLAIKYKDQFDYINIFSDSQISIFGLRDYIYKWKYNIKDELLYTSSGKPAVNQEIFIECHKMLLESGLYNKINLIHQSGHINSNYASLQKAAVVFRKANGVAGPIDLNFIRYISTYNDFVDHNSRSLLHATNMRENKFVDPVKFVASGNINKN